MTVKVGDSVRYSDDVGGGRVIRIISKEIAEIETEDGWILPAHIRSLVVIPEDGKLVGHKPSKLHQKSIRPKPVDQSEPEGAAVRKKPVLIATDKVRPREVDLHINKLIDRVVGLTNTEILTIQLDTFRKEMTLAIRNKERDIVFIHGIGNGTLKNELRRVASHEFNWCSQEDASFREYGFGATRIRIPQNKPPNC